MDSKQYEAGAPPPPTYNQAAPVGGAPPPYNPQQPGYPPQQTGYPPQQTGYPPQQQTGYPPQQAGYPPQQAGYPAYQMQTAGGYQPVPQGAPVIVATQPQVIVAGPSYKPPNNMILAIIGLFFNLCCAIPAVIYSSNSDSAFSRGDVEQARRHGQTSKNLSIAAIVSGIILCVGIPILYFVVIVGMVYSYN